MIRRTVGAVLLAGCGSSATVADPGGPAPEEQAPVCGGEVAATFAWGFGEEGGHGYALSVAVDGTIYLGGAGDLTLPRCANAPTFGEGTGFIAQLDGGGHVLWERRFELGGNDTRNMALDAAYGPGVAFAVDVLEGADLGTGSLRGGMAVGRLDEHGSPLFARVFGFDSNPVCFAAGFDGTLLFGAGCPHAPVAGERLFCAHDHEAFALRLDSGGRIAAHRTFSGDLSARLPAVEIKACALTPGGDAVIAGRLHLSSDFGRAPEDATGLFIARYDAEIALHAVRIFPDVYSTVIDVVADPRNADVVLAGDLSGPHDLGGGRLPYGQAADLFLARYDGELDHVWSRAIATDTPDYLEELGISPDGDTLVAARIGGSDGTSPGLEEIPSFVELDARGEASSVMQLPVEFVRDVAATPDGGRLLTGSLSEHEGPADFGSGPLEGTGYVVKISAP